MAARSAGLLMYRWRGNLVEVLLVHPGGPYWQGRDAGAWSIPKGEIAPGEDPLAAAQREFAEELGVTPTGPFIELGEVRQRGGKCVRAWAMPGDLRVEAVHSNQFEVEWPPNSGRSASFPEVDEARFFSLASARERINAAQRDLLDRLADAVGGGPG